MKKILFALLAAVLVFSVSGCDKKGDKEETTSVSVSTTDTTTQSIASMDDGLQGDGTNQNEPEPDEVEVKKYNELPLYNIAPFATPVVINSLNGGDGYEPLAYGDGKILFAKDEYEESWEAGQSTVTQRIFLFNVADGEEEFVTERVRPNYGSDNHLFLDNRYYVRGEWSQAYEAEVILVTDVIAKETSVFEGILSHSRKLVEYSGHEFIDFRYYQDEEEDIYYQCVNLCNIKTGKVKEIVSNESSGGSSIEISGAAVCDGKLYVLFHGAVDGKLYTFIRVYDGDGNIIDNISNIKLGSEISDTKGYYFSVSAFYVFGDYFFLEAYGELFFGFEYKNNKLTQFYGADGKLRSDDVPSYETPVSGVIDGRYVIFTGRSDVEVKPGVRDLELMLLDTHTGEMSRFSFRIGDTYRFADGGTYVGKNGDMVLTVFYDEDGEYQGYYKTMYFCLKFGEAFGRVMMQ